jgi:thioredoxin reductase
MTLSHKTYYADYVVVGSGVAGLRAAIELSAAGNVLVLAKSNLSDSATCTNKTPSMLETVCAARSPWPCWSRKGRNTLSN